MNNQMTDAILEQHKRAAYEEGVRYALSYLQDLYESIEETDIWADFMSEEEGK